MKISAVIVVHGNSTREVEACLESIGPLIGQIVIVDNSPMPTARYADPRVKVFTTRNQGFGTAQNKGVGETHGDLVLLLNPDVVLQTGALEVGVRHMRENPNVAAVQGVCRSPDGSPDRSQGILLAPLHLWGRALGARRLRSAVIGRALGARLRLTQDHLERVPSSPQPVEWLSATALLVRRFAFDQIGGFDESFFLYGEDQDLCRRMTMNGWSLVALPVDWATHRGGGSSSGFRQREIEWWRGSLRFAMKWWSFPGRAQALVATLLRGLTAMSSSVSAPLEFGRIAAAATWDRRRWPPSGPREKWNTRG